MIEKDSKNYTIYENRKTFRKVGTEGTGKRNKRKKDSEERFLE